MTPICPKCSVAGAVGVLCPDCGSNRSSHLYQVHPGRLALGAVLGLASGTLVGLVLQHVSGYALFYLLFICSAVGGFLGEMILRLTGRKRGPKVEFVAGLSVVGGAAASVGITCLTQGGLAILLDDPLSLCLFLVAVGLTAAAAVAKIKYF